MSGTVTVTNLGNWDSLETGQQSVAAAGTAEALNDGTELEVPRGATLAIRAQDNTGPVYVGDATVDAASGFELVSGEGVSLNVTDVSSVYIDADNAGDGVTWVVEVDA